MTVTSNSISGGRGFLYFFFTHARCRPSFYERPSNIQSENGAVERVLRLLNIIIRFGRNVGYVLSVYEGEKEILYYY